MMTGAGITEVPRISVVTVTRNSADFVEETLKSVAEQNYSDIEYIVVDGASTDRTIEILKKYSSSITKWVSEPDRGIADAFNKGFALTTGDYVLFLNSDDRLKSRDAIANIVQAITASGWPDLIYGDCELVERTSGNYLYTARIEFSPRSFKWGRTLPHPSLFTSRHYFDRYGRFDTGFRIAMDYEFLLRGALTSRVVHVPVVVTEVRTGGISTRSPAVVSEIVRAMRKVGVVRTSLGAAWVTFYFRCRGMLRAVRDQLNRSRTGYRGRQGRE